MKIQTSRLKTIINVLPGLILCFIVMFSGIYLADSIGMLMKFLGLLSEESETPISGIFIAIIVGIIIRNFINVSSIFIEGIIFSMKFILRAGIILLGLRLSLLEVLKIGVYGVPLIILCISSGIIVTLYLTRKMNQSMRLGTLIASGTGICGVTAIMATSPVIKAQENEVSYAVANITIFGLTSMILYPFLANFVFMNDPVKIGLFLGTAIHDTAQVAGAALIYDQIYSNPIVIETATVTKLIRNLFIIAVIPILSLVFYKYANRERRVDSETEIPKWYAFIPLFVIGFFFLSIVRTVGDTTLENIGLAFGFLPKMLWESIHSSISSFGTTYLLGIAMAGVGLSTDIQSFKGIGVKPFYIGFVAAITIGGVSIILISLFGDLI